MFWRTFLLALFFGVFGAHHFLMGRIRTGILQFCTLGLCGLWALIDVILILLGIFKDRFGCRVKNTSPRASWILFSVLILVLMASALQKPSLGDKGLERSMTDPRLEVEKEEKWLQNGEWEIVNANVPLMKGAMISFQPDRLNIQGGGVTVKRSFKVVDRRIVDGREILNVIVDQDSLIILKPLNDLAGTESISMTWGRDGSGSLGLGRRIK